MKQGDIIASKYRLVTRIGQGGMGSVWHVVNAATGRDFAIKFLHAAVASSEDSRSRFMQEARASARINHPNAIDIFDVGETEDGGLYLVMELLDGISLADALRSEPPFNARDLLIALSEACTALHAAHTAGVIHRDLKPANIFLHKDRATGYASSKVLDFGVSKLTVDDGVATHTGSLLGSPRYMSPEQAISASAADARSDIWSIGVVLFEALTGRFPHDGDSSNNLIIAIATKPPKSIQSVAPQLPRSLQMLVDDCLRPTDQRIQSVSLLLDRMLAILATEDLRDVPLARPTLAKGKSRARPDGLAFRTTPGQIPGLATTMLEAHGLGALARHLRGDGTARPLHVQGGAAPPLRPRAEEATNVLPLQGDLAARMQAARFADPPTPSTIDRRSSSADGERTQMQPQMQPQTQPQMQPPTQAQRAPSFGGYPAPPMPGYDPRASQARLPEPAPEGRGFESSYGSHPGFGAQTFGQPGVGQPVADPSTFDQSSPLRPPEYGSAPTANAHAAYAGGAMSSVPQATPSHPSMAGQGYFAADPTTESISSINVVRGSPSSLISSVPAMPPAPAPRSRMAVLVAAGVGVVTLGVGLLVVRSLTKADAPTASAAAASTSTPASEPREHRTAPASPPTSTVAATPIDALAPATAASNVPAASSARAAPSASATAKPNAQLPAQSGPRGDKPATTSDPRAKIMGNDPFK